MTEKVYLVTLSEDPDKVSLEKGELDLRGFPRYSRSECASACISFIGAGTPEDRFQDASVETTIKTISTTVFLPHLREKQPMNLNKGVMLFFDKEKAITFCKKYIIDLKAEDAILKNSTARRNHILNRSCEPRYIG